MDDIDQYFSRLRSGPFARMNADPSATAYESQGGTGAPLGFVDELDAFSTDYVALRVYNGSFTALPPEGANTNLAVTTNELPGWWGSPVSVSGSAITFQVVPDESGQTYSLRANVAAGAAGDEAYIQRIERIPDSPLFSIYPIANAYCSTAMRGTLSSTTLFVDAQYLYEDESTVGLGGTSSATAATIDSGTNDYYVVGRTGAGIPNSTGVVPLGATKIRIRLRVKRNGDGNSAAGSIDVTDVQLLSGSVRMLFTDASSPTIYSPGYIEQSDGKIRIAPDLGDSGLAYVDIDHSGFVRLYAPEVFVDGTLTLDRQLALAEIAAPGTPPTGFYYLYPKTDGILYGKNDAGTEIAFASAADLAAHLADTSDAHDASAISILDTANDFTATDVEGALAELQSDAEADATALSDHIADTADAHDASAISILDTANDFTATDVEGALAELQSDNEAHVAAADPHTGYLLESLLDAKGDLIVASAADTPARLAVGTNDYVLTAASGEATGLKWAAAAGGHPTVTVRTTPGAANWTPASGSTFVHVRLYGAGGGGASGAEGTNAAVRCGGSAGGGGAMIEATFRIADLTTPVSVTIGTGGTGGVAAGGAAGVDGTAGGNTTFGSYLTAYGGGAGLGAAVAPAADSGGSGGGWGGAGNIGVTAADSTGGLPAQAAGAIGLSGQGGGSDRANQGQAAEYGGGGGGGHGNAADADRPGGTSLFGGGGGGAGGNGGISQNTGSAGGNTGVWTAAGGGGGGGGAVRTAGTPGASGAGLKGGTGGGGGGGSTSTSVSAGNGGAGGLYGGGGGGGGGCLSGGASTAGNGGNGGDGGAIITEW